MFSEVRWHSRSLLIQSAVHVVESARLCIIFRGCGLGAREGLLTLAGAWLGFGMDTGLLVAGIDRAAMLLWTFVLGLPSVASMARQMVSRAERHTSF